VHYPCLFVNHFKYHRWIDYFFIFSIDVGLCAGLKLLYLEGYVQDPSLWWRK